MCLCQFGTLYLSNAWHIGQVFKPLFEYWTEIAQITHELDPSVWYFNYQTKNCLVLKEFGCTVFLPRLYIGLKNGNMVAIVEKIKTSNDSIEGNGRC